MQGCVDKGGRLLNGSRISVHSRHRLRLPSQAWEILIHVRQKAPAWREEFGLADRARTVYIPPRPHTVDLSLQPLVVDRQLRLHHRGAAQLARLVKQNMSQGYSFLRLLGLFVCKSVGKLYL